MQCTKIILDPFLQQKIKKKTKKSIIITVVMVILQVYWEYKVFGKQCSVLRLSNNSATQWRIAVQVLKRLSCFIAMGFLSILYVLFFTVYSQVRSPGLLWQFYCFHHVLKYCMYIFFQITWTTLKVQKPQQHALI